MRSLALVYLITTLVAASAVTAKDAGDSVDVYVTVASVHEMPAGSALPGVHLDARINGRSTDVYVAPTEFLEQFGITFATGDDVHVVGTRAKAGGMEVVLAREISVGAANRITLYLRDENGPFWTADTRPGHR